MITTRHVEKMSRFPDVAQEVEGYAKQLGIELNVVEGGVS